MRILGGHYFQDQVDNGLLGSHKEIEEEREAQSYLHRPINKGWKWAYKLIVKLLYVHSLWVQGLGFISMQCSKVQERCLTNATWLLCFGCPSLFFSGHCNKFCQTTNLYSTSYEPLTSKQEKAFVNVNKTFKKNGTFEAILYKLLCVWIKCLMLFCKHIYIIFFRHPKIKNNKKRHILQTWIFIQHTTQNQNSACVKRTWSCNMCSYGKA